MFKIVRQTPASLGYSFPAEWAPHRATWLSWPRPEAISFPGTYHRVIPNLVEIVRQIQSREQVHINVPNVDYERIVRQHLKEYRCPQANVFFHYIKTNECWCRDHGPAFVCRKARPGTSKVAIVDWNYNAWGGKYPPFADDDAVPTAIAQHLKLPAFAPGIIMEGGSVDFNGFGTVMTTRCCLLNKNRNPHLSIKQIENYLKNYYGQRHVLWLDGEIVGDDTDGHVDDLARFVTPRRIVTAVQDDPRDINYRALQENWKRLQTATDQDGRKLEIIPLPMPHPVYHDGMRLPATYMNFYFINGALLLPTYRDRRNDAKAADILQSLLPKRKIIPVDCVELIWGFGSIHCMTQQQPRG